MKCVLALFPSLFTPSSTHHPPSQQDVKEEIKSALTDGHPFDLFLEPDSVGLLPSSWFLVEAGSTLRVELKSLSTSPSRLLQSPEDIPSSRVRAGMSSERAESRSRDREGYRRVGESLTCESAFLESTSSSESDFFSPPSDFPCTSPALLSTLHVLLLPPPLPRARFRAHLPSRVTRLLSPPFSPRKLVRGRTFVLFLPPPAHSPSALSPKLRNHCDVGTRALLRRRRIEFGVERRFSLLLSAGVYLPQRQSRRPARLGGKQHQEEQSQPRRREARGGSGEAESGRAEDRRTTSAGEDARQQCVTHLPFSFSTELNLFSHSRPLLCLGRSPSPPSLSRLFSPFPPPSRPRLPPEPPRHPHPLRRTRRFSPAPHSSLDQLPPSSDCAFDRDAQRLPLRVVGCRSTGRHIHPVVELGDPSRREEQDAVDPPRLKKPPLPSLLLFIPLCLLHTLPLSILSIRIDTPSYAALPHGPSRLGRHRSQNGPLLFFLGWSQRCCSSVRLSSVHLLG